MDEIVPGPRRDGHEFRQAAGRPEFAVVRDEFDLVQTLLRPPGTARTRASSTLCAPSPTPLWTAPGSPG
ncbi:hypothetical protein SUDANB43_04770 [Streptomyces sp. enrichment culture]